MACEQPPCDPGWGAPVSLRTVSTVSTLCHCHCLCHHHPLPSSLDPFCAQKPLLSEAGGERQSHHGRKRVWGCPVRHPGKPGVGNGVGRGLRFTFLNLGFSAGPREKLSLDVNKLAGSSVPREVWVTSLTSHCRHIHRFKRVVENFRKKLHTPMFVYGCLKA